TSTGRCRGGGRARNTAGGWYVMTTQTAPPRATLPAGTPCWVALASADATAAQEFYGELFGWDIHVQRDPSTRDRRYAIASRQLVQTAGIRQANHDDRGWSIHLAVHNTATAVEWVRYLGGSLTLGPVDIPERGRILHATAPGGVHVVFWELAP